MELIELVYWTFVVFSERNKKGASFSKKAGKIDEKKTQNTNKGMIS